MWGHSANAILSITTNQQILSNIKTGYKTDKFCKQLSSTGMKNMEERDGLWYISSQLVIPQCSNIRENLFCLTHNTLGHFGGNKSYATLCDVYYWLYMRRDLESTYIPSCVNCQWNKSCTIKVLGPLHPLPVPDRRGNSIAIDFVGPLPPDNSYNCLISMTDHLNSNIHIIPTRIHITAEDFTMLFFDQWYCENSLPLNIVSDRNKLFVSQFWAALMKITGIKLKMSLVYHPETDGASERLNKTINQSLRYHVHWNQKGWVWVLLQVQFCIMNTVNVSTGFSPFQLWMGWSPRVIPPFTTDTKMQDDYTISASEVIKCVDLDVEEVKDNLTKAKITMANYANVKCEPENVYKLGKWVMLSTLHQRNEYKFQGEKCVAKFFPCYNG